MTGLQKRFMGIFSFAGTLLAGAGAGQADAIDGSWCFKGRHLEIEGPKIVIPSGKQITGDYSRHAFVYVVPPGDSGAGMNIFMGLLDEETMELRVGSEQADAEVWHRCAAPVS